MHASLPHVVIVGGGFGGLSAARALVDKTVRVTLLDRRNHHLFQPLLYQVAAVGLVVRHLAPRRPPDHRAVECRGSLGRPPVTFGTANRREDEQPPCPKGDDTQ